MADKQVTVPVPEDRVAEFYAWFASFLASEPGSAPGGRGPRNRPGRHEHLLAAWSSEDGDRAAWLYDRLAPGARELVDMLAAAPGRRLSGNEVAARLAIDKGAHGVAGILAWPGRYSRRLGRALPIATEGRPDGGTDYFMEPDVAALFAGRDASGPADREPDRPGPPPAGWSA
jgi:uncharacterized protein DUF6416